MIGDAVRAQLLHRPAGLGVPAAVRHLVAVQAQDARSARLALRARIAGLRAPDADGRDDLVVSWLLRGTLHLVHRDDLPWLHALAPPPAPGRLRELGVGEPEVARVAAALPFPRAQAGEALGLTGQAVPHALRLAALRGVCVLGLDGVVRAVQIAPVERSRALAELGRRYLVAHPGADAADLAAWAGIGRRDAAAALGAVMGTPGSPAGAGAGGARLLPPFDPYLLGRRDRSFAVPEALRARVFPGGGMFRATMVRDGIVVGTWGAAGGRVTLDGPDHEAFAAEVTDVERFLAGR